MHPLPTVRVANPAASGTYMVINASDLTEAHDVWPEQAEGYVAPEPILPRLDPAERDAAAVLGLKLLVQKLSMEGRDYYALPPAERLDAILQGQAEIDAAVTAHKAAQEEVAAVQQTDAASKTAEPSNTSLRVAKGPRGLHYVYRGIEKVSKGYATEDEAVAAMAQGSVGA